MTDIDIKPEYHAPEQAFAATFTEPSRQDTRTPSQLNLTGASTASPVLLMPTRVPVSSQAEWLSGG